jgi:hypothetical protein
MNNTHFAIINSDNNPFAIIRNEGDIQSRLVIAICEEYDTDAANIPTVDFNDSQFQRNDLKLNVTITVDEVEETISIQPIWEY